MDVYLAMLPLKFSKVNDKIVKQRVQIQQVAQKHNGE